MTERRHAALPPNLPPRRVRALPARHFNHVQGVYFVGFGGYVKIGWSAKVGKRVRDLQVSAPEKLRVYLVILDGTFETERHYHRQFAELRLLGEWFKLKAPLTDFIAEQRDMPGAVWRPEDLYNDDWSGFAA